MRVIYSSTTLYLKEIETRLESLDMPIYYKLPDPDVLEPFIVIGSHNSNTGRTAKVGKVIEDNTLNVDIYLPIDSRTEAEETRSKAIKAIGRREGVDSTILTDDSIGRETYHIPMRISEIVI